MAERGTDAPTGVAVAVRIAVVLSLLVILLASVRFARFDWSGLPLDRQPTTVVREVSDDCVERIEPYETSSGRTISPVTVDEEQYLSMVAFFRGTPADELAVTCQLDPFVRRGATPWIAHLLPGDEGVALGVVNLLSVLVATWATVFAAARPAAPPPRHRCGRRAVRHRVEHLLLRWSAADRRRRPRPGGGVLVGAVHATALVGLARAARVLPGTRDGRGGGARGRRGLDPHRTAGGEGPTRVPPLVHRCDPRPVRGGGRGSTRLGRHRQGVVPRGGGHLEPRPEHLRLHRRPVRPRGDQRRSSSRRCHCSSRRCSQHATASAPTGSRRPHRARRGRGRAHRRTVRLGLPRRGSVAAIRVGRLPVRRIAGGDVLPARTRRRTRGPAPGPPLAERPLRPRCRRW